ncbi:Pimeloyl-ACP methyl ester carboxylesterase [Salinimicrobium catena]|uniref:Pimeloyl-ACP methyl ester carboxylesterase n=1 Tax=Salinimicrobium catena TaxID=390640 RepID=A0A1H5J924_9FLAO|nr:alpha/beta hydrolase [Salinimicrobium catena]SDK85560.1 Pimeloyl-ACP methyl ester carboxylesterase [Salinimicrobium catena]SEE48989.1 Pimeloyl-ACP methyl ester carboxylesterase [Salinimicrobium catena]
MKIRYRNKDIHYTSEGTGETAVLLHGFLESKEIWTDFIPEFLKYGRVITIDLPGHGESEVIEEVHTMELMADAVYAVLKEEKVQQANFIGHSMGGYVALAFLEKHPSMMHEFMLLNSTPKEDSREKKTNRERAIEVVKKNKRAFISMAISNLLTPENDKKFVKEVNEIKERAYQFPAEGIIAALKGMKIRTNKEKLLAQFNGTKVIVTGQNDPLIELKAIKSIADKCNCRFFTLPGGHLSYLESRKNFIKLCISSKK